MHDNSFELNAAQGFDAKAFTELLKNKAALEDTTTADQLKKAEAKLAPKALELTKAQLADIIESQVRGAITRFVSEFNKNSVGNWVAIDLVITETRELVAAIELRVNKKGKQYLGYRKAYKFSHPEQMKNKGEWKLTLISDLLQNLVGGGLLYSIVLDDAKEQDPTAFLKP